ncbi:hypothetical protein BKA64DRAFT_447803 [Cadophora sp. MPI-SDFR-AT-0126]|nr:hypothetical protein BKA64DRAFT_447803 [Leotiomycetes sp. MPI-SDFR-AT-0126]
MAFLEHNEFEGHAPFEHFSDWTCPKCFRKMSATRPPVFNADNCSCDEVALFHAGDAGYYSEPATYEHQLYNSEVTAPLYHNQAQSVASSSASVPSPEGPERKDLDLQVGNAYLPLLEAQSGHNEEQHQRTASFHSDLSYPLQRFLGELKTYPPAIYDTEHEDHTFTPKFLSQEIHLQSSKKAKKGSPHSKLSWMSDSSRSGDASVESWGMNPLAGAGMWDDQSGYAKTGNGLYGYAMHLSGMSEGAVFDDDDDETN